MEDIASTFELIVAVLTCPVFSCCWIEVVYIGALSWPAISNKSLLLSILNKEVDF